MNRRNLSASRKARVLGWSIAFAILWSLATPLPGADAPAGSGGGAAKPYLLFMGANLSAVWRGKLWPIRGVRRNAFVIDVHGKPVAVLDTKLRMKIDSALKLTTDVATVADLKTKRAYTAANDPRGKASQAMMVDNLQSHNLDVANYHLNAITSAAGRGGRGTVFSEDPSQAQADFNRALDSQGSEMSDVGAAMSREQNELDRKLFDALSLSFKVSAARPVENPYLVVIVRFRDKANDPRTARLMVYGQVLPSIGKRPQAVHLFRGGFPRGYQLESCQIHLFDRRGEIGTNVAPEHVAMSRAEAFQFSMANYVVRHRGKTLPPAPARAFWPKDLATRLSPKERDRSLYVRVDKAGQVSGFYSDKACTRPVRDSGLDAVRSELVFDPALKMGAAVEGVTAVTIGRTDRRSL